MGPNSYLPFREVDKLMIRLNGIYAQGGMNITVSRPLGSPAVWQVRDEILS